MTVVRAAAVQMSPVLYSREGTVQKVVDKIAELGRHHVEFATFPETIVPYYPYFSLVQRPFELGTEQLRLIDHAIALRCRRHALTAPPKDPADLPRTDGVGAR